MKIYGGQTRSLIMTMDGATPMKLMIEERTDINKHPLTDPVKLIIEEKTDVSKLYPAIE
jgi:hypothetical protein